MTAIEAHRYVLRLRASATGYGCAARPVHSGRGPRARRFSPARLCSPGDGLSRITQRAGASSDNHAGASGDRGTAGLLRPPPRATDQRPEGALPRTQ